MTAFSSGGRRAAICRPLKPPHEMPMMPTAPVRPGLRRDPVQHLQRVVLLLLQVLALEHALRIAGAAHVDAHGGIAVAGEIGMVQRIALGGAVALAVGQIFEDRRHRVLLGIDGQPDHRREDDPVGERDLGVLDDADLVREFGSGAHGNPGWIAEAGDGIVAARPLPTQLEL